MLHTSGKIVSVKRLYLCLIRLLKIVDRCRNALTSGQYLKSKLPKWDMIAPFWEIVIDHSKRTSSKVRKMNEFSKSHYLQGNKDVADFFATIIKAVTGFGRNIGVYQLLHMQTTLASYFVIVKYVDVISDISLSSKPG